MFSKELQIMDRNTVKYMIDDLQEKLDVANEQLNSTNEQLDNTNKQLIEAQSEVIRLQKLLSDNGIDPD